MGADGGGDAPLATLEGYERRYGAPTEPDRVSALLADASDALLSEYELYWGEPWAAGAHPAFDRSAEAVCCAVVRRAVATEGSLPGATQLSQGAGDYTASVTLASPGGDLYVGKSDRRRLGLAGCRVGSIRPMTAADREGGAMTSMPDLGLIRGETVTVRTPAKGHDEHMEEVVTWEEAVVENVVVTPGATSDVLDTARPDGTRVAFTLGFPKTFAEPLRGCHVLVRGIECAVIGDPQPYTAENTPGAHNLTAEVARVDG